MELNNTELQSNYEDLDSKINSLMTVFLDLKTIIKEHKQDINLNMDVSDKSKLKIQQVEDIGVLNTNNINTNNNKLKLLENFKNNVLERLKSINHNKMINVKELTEINCKISKDISNYNNKINEINQSIININQKNNIIKNDSDEHNNKINLIRENLNTHVEEYSSNIKSINDYIQISHQSLQLLDELSKTNQGKINQYNGKIENNTTGLSKVKQTINEINNIIAKYTGDLEKCIKNTDKINIIESNINEKLITHIEEYNNNMVNIQKITDGNKEVFSLIDNKILEIDNNLKSNIRNVSNNTNFINGFNDIIKDKLNSINEKILVEKKITQRLFNNIDFPNKLHQKTLIDFRISEGKNNFITYHNLDDIMKQTEIKNYLIINKAIPNDISLIDFSIEDNHSYITSGTINNEVHMSNEYLLFVIIPPEMKLDEDVSKIKIIIRNYNMDKEINNKQFDCMKFQYTGKRNIFVFKFKINMMYQCYYQHCIISLVVNGYTLFEFNRNIYNYDTISYQPIIHGNKYHYHIRPGKITKNVDITIPELEYDDTFVLKNKQQTLHNKKLIFLADEKVSIRKKDLVRITSIIKKLKPMEYYKNNSNLIKHTNVTDEKLKNEYVLESGLLAQHIKMIKPLKHLVSEDPSTGLLSLDYYGFIPYLIQSMKEIISVNESYEKRIKTLENDINVNKDKIDKIIRFNHN